MKPNNSIENSRKLFVFLLNLYPQEHRTGYAACMQQVFVDQCRSAYQEKGIFGLVLLWLRTLPDLGYTAMLEHITSPRATWGLMEPVPNAPLPWKGVFLILLPGLVYLVSQIAQLTGQPWYLVVYYRAAFFLILPVLAVWIITRRFPIWGLIPLGLLFKLIQEIGYQLVVLHPEVFSVNPLLNFILITAKQVQMNPLIPAGLMAVAILILAIYYLRNHKPSNGFWIWGGLYFLLAIIKEGMFLIIWSWDYLNGNQGIIPWNEMWTMIFSNVQWDLYNLIAFLFLIFIGTLFTRRHGFFAILILVGYILPTIVVGIPWNLESNSNQLLIVSTAVIIYRSLLSIIAPIWMSRTSSQEGKKRVVMISIALALAVHAVMQFYPLTFSTEAYSIGPDWFFSVLLEELKLVSAFLLAIVLYQDEPSKPTIPGQAYGAFPVLSREKA
jgi:hypothetical protein